MEQETIATPTSPVSSAPAAVPTPQASSVCQYCKTQVEATAFYCPTCGKKIREKPLNTTFWFQVGLYAASILLPPLNLIWAVKYYKSPDPKAKKIGTVSLIITVFALIISLWIASALFKNISQQITGQMDQYQYLGL